MNNFFCMIENGIIYQVDTYNKTPIGYTNQSYEDLEKTTQEYYSKLVELGVIIPPKTQEEINEELQKELKESREINQQLLEMMKELKDGGKKSEPVHDKQNKADVS